MLCIFINMVSENTITWGESWKAAIDKKKVPQCCQTFESAKMTLLWHILQHWFAGNEKKELKRHQCGYISVHHYFAIE